MKQSSFTRLQPVFINLTAACLAYFQDALEIMSVIAVMVNCALIGMSGLADRLFPDLGTVERIIFIVLLEVFLLPYIQIQSAALKIVKLNTLFSHLIAFGLLIGI